MSTAVVSNIVRRSGRSNKKENVLARKPLVDISNVVDAAPTNKKVRSGAFPSALFKSHFVGSIVTDYSSAFGL